MGEATVCLTCPLLGLVDVRSVDRKELRSAQNDVASLRDQLAELRFRPRSSGVVSPWTAGNELLCIAFRLQRPTAASGWFKGVPVNIYTEPEALFQGLRASRSFSVSTGAQSLQPHSEDCWNQIVPKFSRSRSVFI